MGGPAFIPSQSLQEGGEAYSNIGRVDREMASIRVGHSLQVQFRNFVKYDGIRAWETVDKHLRL